MPPKARCVGQKRVIRGHGEVLKIEGMNNVLLKRANNLSIPFSILKYFCIFGPMVKKKIHIFLIALFLIGHSSLFGQPAEYKMSRDEYVEKYKDDAVKEMLTIGVPASITLAQGMLESGNGNSALAVYANNHFGIKCHEDWDGMTYIQDDDASNECFRKYNNVLESFTDHSLFLKNRDRYQFLFELKISDYKAWAKGLKQAGYATDPAYADKLIQIIEQFNLNVLDKMTVMPVTQSSEEPKEKSIIPIKKQDDQKILYNNDLKYVIAKPGDSYFTLAKKLDMGLWQLYKYNETGKNAAIRAGDIVYLQQKRRRGSESTYTAKKGDTMYTISQKFGVKVKFLYKKNHMNPGDEPKVGDVINLRTKKKK